MFLPIESVYIVIGIEKKDGQIGLIVSELRLYNFRKFKSVDGNPGLIINFHTGLNAIIGENDSGKSSIIDAMKLVLHTQSNEYIRPTDDDFYTNESGESVDEFKIKCIISDIEPNEAKNFIEYLNFVKDKSGGIHYYLFLHFRSWKDGKNSSRIYSELKVGDEEEGVSITGKARELLKAVYLKPLRDAEREMSAGRGSRISQILLNHPVMREQMGEEHKLIKIFKEANENIEDYFTDDEEGSVILKTIRENLGAFDERREIHDAELRASDVRLRAILESMSLNVTEIHPGLGELNLLFIAAELLLLAEDMEGGIRLALIEELEAHLHPQAQLRLINFLQNEYVERGSQIIISTHSPILASKINLKNIILLKDNMGFELTEGKTALRKGDYLFLQRFLDATKSNMFFAKGIIMVEGDAENLLIPTIAEIIGYPLEKYGVSIVNVGSTAFLRYSSLFVRVDGKSVNIPVAVVTDCDVKPSKLDNENGLKLKIDKSKLEEEIAKKEQRYNGGSVKTFVSPIWTLEYCLARSFLYEDVLKAVLYAKRIYNSEDISLTKSKIRQANEEAESKLKDWNDLSKSARAYRIFEFMTDANGSSKIKAILAQCLSSMMKWEISVIPEGLTQENMFDMDLYRLVIDNDKKIALANKLIQDTSIAYIVNAIKYAVGANDTEG